MINHWQLNLAVNCMKKGGVIAYPTESVYGLGCDAYNLKAVERLLEIKRRSYKKGLILLVSDIGQAFSILMPLSSEQLELMKRPSNRATTWLMNPRADLSPLLVGLHTKLAVRVTNNQIAKRLCEQMKGPIVSTSCNFDGKQTPTTPSKIRNQMQLKVDKVFSGTCGGQAPSKIIDLDSQKVFRK